MKPIIKLNQYVVLAFAMALVLGCKSGKDNKVKENTLQVNNIPVDKDLRSRLNEFASKPRTKGNFAFSVYDLTADKPVCGYDENKTLPVASCLKLLSGVAGLHLLGTHYMYATSLYTKGNIDNGTLHGDVAFKCGLDPQLNEPDLDMFAKQLKKKGIKKVDGKLVVDLVLTDPVKSEQLQNAAAAYQDAANKFATAQTNFADRYLDCTQTGWGITPIVGLDVKYGKFNLGTRLEFTNHLNIENDTKVDDTGLFKDGVNTPNDLPGLFTIGGQYEILPSVRVMASYHYFFDKDAKMANDKQKYLSGNTKEYLAGAEWDVTKGITVSCGLQRTKYGLGDGTYLNDMSFVTSSHSYGFGAKIKVTKNASLNIAYFWTNYEHFKKEYTQTFSAGANSLSAQCTDDFTRTNKVLGVGLDIDL